jgi:mannose/fructose/N-acetylgalactosamine-specific phosphotransferase system component IIC
MTLSILMAIPFGIVAKKIDVKIIESNNRLSDQALEDAKAVDLPAIERKVYLGLAKSAVFYMALLFLLQIIFIPALIWIYPNLPFAFKAMLSLMYYFLPLLGVAVALNSIKLRGAVPVFCVIFLVAAAALDYFNVF